jgi:two-component system, OmpR family, phosphate regulon sensor histidine kinase PhoR
MEVSVENSNEAIQVLVVDDEQDIREGSARILKRIGFDVATASRGEEGLESLAVRPAAIVLLDLKMPGIDGMEVLGRIREMDETVLVIVITGYATVETAIEAMKQGAYDFIPKPFEPDQLRIVVNRAAEKIRLTREADKLERERRRTLVDLDTEKSRISTILHSLPDGVVVTNHEGRAVLVNPAARSLLDLPDDQATGEPIERYISEPNLCQLIMEISRGQHVDYEDIPNQEFNVGNDCYLMARAQPVLGDRNACLGAVVNLVDITPMKVIDRLKSEFVAKVSHELRSPLSTIHEQLAVVMRDMGGANQPGDQHILARAKEKTHGLISMISDLLDLSRIEEGLICQESQPVQVDELLANIVDFLKSRAESKKQTLTFEAPPNSLPQLDADPLALESIFGNLIANAINYTQEGGKIRVSTDVAGINVRVKVSDNGFGIDERHLGKIFERFYRVKNEKTRYITGTGLGLPIVKQLAESLGGMIEVESAPGVGSTFIVLIPTRV